MAAAPYNRRTTKWQAQRSAAPHVFFFLAFLHCFCFSRHFNAAAGIYEMASHLAAKPSLLRDPQRLGLKFREIFLIHYLTEFRRVPPEIASGNVLVWGARVQDEILLAAEFTADFEKKYMRVSSRVRTFPPLTPTFSPLRGEG
jgi:hypothetical protein